MFTHRIQLGCHKRMTLVNYCHLCFGVSKKCGCSSVPCQTPGQASALWTPPTMSYVAMASSTETTASSSVGRAPPPRYPTPGLPPLEPAPMDMLLAPTSKNLLDTIVMTLWTISITMWPQAGN